VVRPAPRAAARHLPGDQVWGKAKIGPDGRFNTFADPSPKHARAACERSLNKLGVDCIDLYYIHRLDEKTPVEKTIEEMVQLKK
jgi:aryl-alcohol dehydrogenase-like predicted oxidoreductase